MPLLAGLGAMALGLALLAGLFVPRRERLVTLDEDANGRLAARRRPLAQTAGALVEQVRGVTQVKAKVRPGRRKGGRIRLTADRSRTADAKMVQRAADEALHDLTSSFALRARIRTRLGDGGSRVE